MEQRDYRGVTKAGRLRPSFAGGIAVPLLYSAASNLGATRFTFVRPAFFSAYAKVIGRLHSQEERRMVLVIG
jgi:ribulose kinase